jgi:hypothetical protein
VNLKLEMNMISGYSYPSTGSIAYPLRTRSREVFDQGMAAIVLELVHPGNLGELPPKPARIAMKGEQIGVAKFGEFWRTVWY